ncbi:MAG TPA: amidohydrolase family protein [Trueperaceae bacterium]
MTEEFEYGQVLASVQEKVRLLSAGRTAIRASQMIADAESGEVLRDHTLVIEGGLVREVVPSDSFEIPQDVEVMDVPSGTLLPGLIETHCHVTGEWSEDPHATHLEPFPEARVIRGMVDAWAVLTAGFTSIYSMGHGHPNYVAALKSLIDDERFPGPRIHHCGWAISQTAGHGHVREWNYELASSLKVRSTFADGEAALRAVVRENIGTGAEFIKVFAGEGGYTAPSHISRRLDFSGAELRAVTDEAHRLGYRVASHCMTLEHVRHALTNGVDRIEHGPTVYEPDFVPILQENQAAWCPTLSQLHWGLEERVKRGFDTATTRRIEAALDARCRMIVEALEAGVVVGFGTDNRMRPKAGRNGIEFRLMVERGIQPGTALALATSNAARLVGVDDQLGSIRPGMVADLIVVNGNPLQDIEAVSERENIVQVLRSPVRVRPKPPIKRGASYG